MQDHWAPLYEIFDDKKIPLDFHFASGMDGFEFASESYGREESVAVGSMLM